MKKRDESQIRDELLALRKQITTEFGPHADLSVLDSIFQGKINSRAVELASAIYDSYSVRDLVAAAEMNAELEKLNFPAEGGEH